MATYINGYAFKPADWGTKGLPIIRIQNLTDSGKDYNYYEGEVKEKYLVRKGDVLISWSASIGVYEWEKEDAWLNQHIFKVVFDKGEVDKRYFKYATGYVLEKSLQYAHGSTMKHLTKGAFDKLPIPIYDLKEQRVIAEKIGKVDEAIFECEAMLADFELLVKSRFVEMFGDPVTNPMGWETGTLADVIRTKASNGFFAKRNAYNPDGNVAVLGVVDVVNRMYSKINDLPRTDATEKDIKKFRVGYGDILFCRSSLVQAGIGKASIVPRGISDDILFECHVIRLQLDMNKCLPEFVQILVSTEYCRNQLIAVSKTATMTTIGQDGVLATKIYIPPLDLQNKFLEVVELADKSKLTIQKSMDNLQELRDSLLQEYFG